MSAPQAWLFLPQMRMTFPTLLERVGTAEALGFHGVALMDHLAPPGLRTAPAFDAIATAAGLLAATRRLSVGHLVLCASFRHPAVLAKEVVTLDHMSGGRFELGLGWGSAPDELGRHGLPDEPPARRAARLAEYLTVLDALFTGEPVEHEGEFFRLRGAVQRPVPLAGRVPLVLGGAGKKLTMPLVERHADWWNLPSYGYARLAELLPLAGRARVSTQQVIGLARDRAELDDVVALTERRFGFWGGLVTGTPDDVAAGLRALAAGGVERFYLQFSDFGAPETLELFAREVLPRLAG